MDEIAKATLIIADDHPLFIKGLIAVLQREFLILGVAEDGKELIDLLKIHQPKVILLDLQMPNMDGLSAAKQINVHSPQIKIIILSAFYDKELESQLKVAGVKGYLTKDIESDFLICQINIVLKGGIVFCESQEKCNLDIFIPTNNLARRYELSSRELEIVSLIRKGLTSNEIAKALFISVNTVEAHRKHIFKKLKLKNIQGLVKFAYEHSL
jgi:DNA-binding NarL/FixJ family response regulator